MCGSLEDWISGQLAIAGAELLACVSATNLVKSRPGFGRVTRPARGSVLASPVLANWDPDPDYFFHWFRDAAIVMDSLRRIWARGRLRDRALACVVDWIRFESACARNDGRMLDMAAVRERTRPDFRQFLRNDDEIVGLHDAAARADTRVDADGAIDIQTWGRPQFDGPALRALTAMRWRRAAGDALVAPVRAELDALIDGDLAFAFEKRNSPCFDLWEEQVGLHYYTRRVTSAALQQGAVEFAESGDTDKAAAYGEAADDLLLRLDQYWSGVDGFFRSRDATASRSDDPDVAVILAALHAGDDSERHGFRDPRIAATSRRLAEGFAGALAINRDRQNAPALGRYVGDIYFRGGAWYVSTFAAAEFQYLSGLAAGEAAEALRRGDAFLETARAFAPQSGLLSEQIDRDTGEQISAKRLAWSYAAFVSCIDARDACAREA